MSVFKVFLVRIFPHFDWNDNLLYKSPYSVRMRENTDQKNSWYEHFLRSVYMKWWLNHDDLDNCNCNCNLITSRMTTVHRYAKFNFESLVQKYILLAFNIFLHNISIIIHFSSFGFRWMWHLWSQFTNLPFMKKFKKSPKYTAWKACKYGVFSGPYWKYGLEKTLYLDTFHTVNGYDFLLFMH